jgi:uncharacterized protein (TIGR03083 family)
MPTSLTVDQHLTGLRAAAARLGSLAAEAGPSAPVPTCPAWTVDRLVAHISMVHRWATAHVAGTDPAAVPKQTTIVAEVDDLPGYYADGHRALAAALEAAPADLRAMTFLNDAGTPREFWSRRQHHETTIHMVDALAASLGREPATPEAAIDCDVAVDGLDELLCGFYTRGRSKLYDGVERTVVVAPSDADVCWLLRVGPTLRVRTSPARAHVDGADAVFTGTAAGLYLALWNRGSEIEASGRTAVLERWRAVQRVRWS